MSVQEYVEGLGLKARTAAAELAKRATAEKNTALEAIAASLERQADAIRAANAVDVEEAKKGGLAPAMVDCLTLTEARFKAMVEGVRHVASLPDPVGEEIWNRERPSKLVGTVPIVKLEEQWRGGWPFANRALTRQSRV